jgi:16S rRNA (guanine1207-N2)-methyltransferase
MADGHYFDAEPAVGSRPATVDLALPDGAVRLRTDRGVFSGRRVDPGTIVLLRQAPAPPASGHLLDLGCGYGPIAVTLARRAPDAVVWAVTPDAVPGSVELAGMWSNPPIRIGKEALHQLLLDWLGRLAPEARAWLVVQKHLGSDSLATWLGRQGHATVRLASRNAYRVLEVGPR